HVIRTTRSAGRLLHALGDRVTVEVHGACVGAGTELAAFGAHVGARNFAFFRLPEVSMGLVPGAGGTVSVTRRIGRHRTAWLALTGARIDVATALAWGLVDERC
ncbi:MAG: enoyl-CoA hydratase/isomerase family protein, partial [Actinomycetia bacterium]|nr:enoyl-CoA hydratase/isomerase family protein [Actinomycetes bacterium]